VPSIEVVTSITNPARKTNNGVTTIRSSDTDENYSSESSLDDLDAVLARHQPPAAVESPKESGKAHGSKRQRFSPRQRTVAARDSALVTRNRNYKYSLNSLIALSDETSASEIKIARLKAKLESATANGAETSVQDPGLKLDQKALSTVIDHDGEGEGGRAHRLYQAVERTGALDQDVVWHFFEADTGIPYSSLLPFPESFLASTCWYSILKGCAAYCWVLQSF
jgi:hypothetical protein